MNEDESSSKTETCFTSSGLYRMCKKSEYCKDHWGEGHSIASIFIDNFHLIIILHLSCRYCNVGIMCLSTQTHLKHLILYHLVCNITHSNTVPWQSRSVKTLEQSQTTPLAWSSLPPSPALITWAPVSWWGESPPLVWHSGTSGSWSSVLKMTMMPPAGVWIKGYIYLFYFFLIIFFYINKMQLLGKTIV